MEERHWRLVVEDYRAKDHEQWEAAWEGQMTETVVVAAVFAEAARMR